MTLSQFIESLVVPKDIDTLTTLFTIGSHPMLPHHWRYRNGWQAWMEKPSANLIEMRQAMEQRNVDERVVRQALHDASPRVVLLDQGLYDFETLSLVHRHMVGPKVTMMHGMALDHITDLYGQFNWMQIRCAGHPEEFYVQNLTVQGAYAETPEFQDMIYRIMDR